MCDAAHGTRRGYPFQRRGPSLARDGWRTCHRNGATGPESALHPGAVAAPADESELTALVSRAAAAGRTIRPVGSSHSSTELIATDDILVTFDRFQEIVSTDRDRAQATVKPGTTLEELGRDLAQTGLDFSNLGDVATQTVAGVIATGTHGSGRDLPNLAAFWSAVVS